MYLTLRVPDEKQKSVDGWNWRRLACSMLHFECIIEFLTNMKAP